MYQSEPYKLQQPKGYADLYLLPVVSEDYFIKWELLWYKAPEAACPPGLCLLCWQPVPALDTCSGGSLWGHSYVVNLVQHKSKLPLKPSAVSSVLVPSASLRLASGSLNAKLNTEMDTFHLSFPQPRADPHTVWFCNNRNAWEERPGGLPLPMAMQISWTDVAT